MHKNQSTGTYIKDQNFVDWSTFLTLSFDLISNLGDETRILLSTRADATERKQEYKEGMDKPLKSTCNTGITPEG